MDFKLDNQKGMTLIELIIGIAISLILIEAIFGIFSSSIKAYQYGFSQETAFNEGRKTISAITNELRYSVVSVPAFGDNAECTAVSYSNVRNSITNGVINLDNNSININGKSYATGLVQDFHMQREGNLIIIYLRLSNTYQGITKDEEFTTQILTGTYF